MAIDLTINNKVKIIGGLEEYNGKTSVIIKDGGVPTGPLGPRKINEGIIGRKAGHHLWVILLDNTNGETAVISEDNLEIIS